MRKQLIIILIIVFSLIPTIYAREASDITDINANGHIEFNGVALYTRFNLIYLQTDTVGDNTRWYLEFNISELPANAIIDQVNLIATGNNPGIHLIYEFDSIRQPSAMADNNGNNQIIYTDSGNGTLYYTLPNSAVNTTYNMDLGATAVTNLQDAVNNSRDYFVMGARGGASNARIWSSLVPDILYRPILLVKWHLATDYVYQFTDTYYENGTLCVPPVNVIATGPGFSEEFNTSGGTTQYYPVEPEAFYWDIGGGYTRYIYNIGSENFTITYPDGTAYNYGFTIKDLTAKTPEYLEAYRIINGTQTLITRQVVEQPNPVYLPLVFGRTYRLMVVFTDGTRYDWGYFVPGSDTSITLILRTVTFTDQAQVLYNHIHVDGTRSADGATITVDYLDDLANTVWANVSIRERNGPVVFTAARNNNSYTLNWASANVSLGYIVTVTGLHGDYGSWGRTFILDRTFTFPAGPTLNGIFGAVSDNFIPFCIVALIVLIFPVNLQPMGLLGGALIATVLTFIQWATWTYDWLAFGWFVAVVINLVAYRDRIGGLG